MALFSTCTRALSFQIFFFGRSSAVHAGLEEDDRLVEIDDMPLEAEEDVSRALARLSGVKLSTVSVSVSRLVYSHPVKELGGGGGGGSEDSPAAKGAERDAGGGSGGGERREGGQVVEEDVRVVVEEAFVRVVLTRDVALPHDSDPGGGGGGSEMEEEASEDTVNDIEEEDAGGIGYVRHSLTDSITRTSSISTSPPPPPRASSVEPTLSTRMPREAGGARGPGGGAGGGGGGGATVEGDKEMEGGVCLVFFCLRHGEGGGRLFLYL